MEGNLYKARRAGLPQWVMDKDSVCNSGDTGNTGLISGSGRSPGERNGNPLRYFYLDNPIDKRAWRATVTGLQRVRHDQLTLPLPLFASSHSKPHRKYSNHGDILFNALKCWIKKKNKTLLLSVSMCHFPECPRH